MRPPRHSRTLGRIPVTEAEVYARDDLDPLTNLPPDWTHDGGTFEVISAQPVRGVEGVWWLIVEPMNTWEDIA